MFLKIKAFLRLPWPSLELMKVTSIYKFKTTCPVTNPVSLFLVFICFDLVLIFLFNWNTYTATFNDIHVLKMLSLIWYQIEWLMLFGVLSTKTNFNRYGFCFTGLAVRLQKKLTCLLCCYILCIVLNASFSEYRKNLYSTGKTSNSRADTKPAATSKPMPKVGFVIYLILAVKKQLNPWNPSLWTSKERYSLTMRILSKVSK